MDPVAAILVAPLDADVADGPAVDLGQPEVGGEVAVEEVIVVGAHHVGAHHEEVPPARRLALLTSTTSWTLPPANRPEEEAGTEVGIVPTAEMFIVLTRLA